MQHCWDSPDLFCHLLSGCWWPRQLLFEFQNHPAGKEYPIKVSNAFADWFICALGKLSGAFDSDCREEQMHTLSSKWMIMGTRLASMTACTCCWLPAVMLDRNHTASYRTRSTHARLQDDFETNIKMQTWPSSSGANTLYTPFLWLNRIRKQRSDARSRTSVETGCCGRGEGGVEALIIVQVRKKGLVFKATGLRCTPMSAETHSCQHPMATSP